MRLKGELLFICLLLLVVLSLGNVSSEASCSIETSEADCDAITNGKVVMRLSDSSNAHGEMKTYTPANYEHVLCCNFGAGSSACPLGGKLVGLSSETNAHAEVPDLVTPNYLNDVCYDGFDYCSSVDVGIPCLTEEVEVLQLALITNSHLGPLDPTGYPQKICCKIDETITQCTLDDAYWSLNYLGIDKIPEDTSVVEGTSVYLVVDGTDCGTNPITFEIFEESSGSDETRQPSSPNPSFLLGKVMTGWDAAWFDDSGADPKYYFDGITALDTIQSEFLLGVTESEIDCGVDIIDFCSDYTSYGGSPDGGECPADTCGVADADVEDTFEEVDCGEFYECKCGWNAGVCAPDWNYIGGCGNDVIDSGEVCDGTEWGDYTVDDCDEWGYLSGGTLACYPKGHAKECQFDVSACVGGTIGVCGNDEINRDETCDGTDWGDYTTNDCGEFDYFSGGVLACYPKDHAKECQFNTLACTGGVGIGGCSIIEETTDDCDDGFLDYTWTGTWSGVVPSSGDFQFQLYEKCKAGGAATRECPAQVQLPFFGFFGVIVSLLVIALVYVVLISKGKKK